MRLPDMDGMGGEPAVGRKKRKQRPARKRPTPRWKLIAYYVNAFGVDEWEAGRMLGMSVNAIRGALWRRDNGQRPHTANPWKPAKRGRDRWTESKLTEKWADRKARRNRRRD